MSSAAVGTHSGAGPLGLMSCVRESSPLQDYELEGEKNVATKRKFWNVKKWFKRKNKDVDQVVAVDSTSIERDVLRSRSASELSISEEQSRRRSTNGSSMHPGLSVSHDSVFHSPNSGSDIELDQAQSTSSLSASQPHIDSRLQSELSERLRLRRGRGDTSEDDEGLPRSPCNSPTTTETLHDKTAIKDLPTKSHSTCSDGSLLSMGSSEMDEESFGQQSSSRNSSKLSLNHEKKSADQIDADLLVEWGGSAVAPLNHSAAHHRVSVRPNKRRAPLRNRGPQLSTNLPATPEVNEDTSIRSVTPETSNREATVEIYASMQITSSASETHQLKCSSLPPGLAAPTTSSSLLDNKLNRSQSNASKFHEEDEEREEKSDKSFFDRIFPRRSGKKRKSVNNNKEENCKMVKEVSAVNTATVYTKKAEVNRPIPIPRSGAAARQRIQPIDLPPASPPKSPKMSQDSIQPKSIMGTSPIHQELENRFRHQMSPPKSTVITTTITSTSASSSSSSTKKEEIWSKMKIPGLSSLQQKVLTLNDDEDSEIDGFKSLGESLAPSKRVLVTKSHSFKASKPNFDENSKPDIKVEPLGAKASSLDSVKHLDETTPIATTISQTFSEIERKEMWKERKTAESQDKDEELLVVKEFIPLLPDNFSEVTISGPSHTAIFNVSTCDSNFSSSKIKKTETSSKSEESKEVTTKETVSVTSIQLKRESTQVNTQTVSVLPATISATVPEFFNRQLNKVEARSSSNVVFSMNSPRIIDEQNKPKIRKFSQEDLEIVEKSPEIDEEKTPATSPLRFKKNETNNNVNNKRKSSIPESPTNNNINMNNNRTSSLDSLLKVDTESDDKSSQDSLDKLDEKSSNSEDGKKVTQVQESVVLRKKSQIKQNRNDDEPELMKVFARRSLKLKDTESESISQQISSMIMMNESQNGDKGNQIESPKEERRKSIGNKVKAEETIAVTKEPVVETKPPEVVKALPKVEQKFVETSELTLRKVSSNNNVFAYHRKTVDSNELSMVKKQPSFQDRRKTDWISPNLIKESSDGDLKISQAEIIAVITPKSEFINEPKNFNQRKAEWEKRAQEAQKKSVP